MVFVAKSTQKRLFAEWRKMNEWKKVSYDDCRWKLKKNGQHDIMTDGRTRYMMVGVVRGHCSNTSCFPLRSFAGSRPKVDNIVRKEKKPSLCYWTSDPGGKFPIPMGRLLIWAILPVTHWAWMISVLKRSVKITENESEASLQWMAYPFALQWNRNTKQIVWMCVLAKTEEAETAKS